MMRSTDIASSRSREHRSSSTTSRSRHGRVAVSPFDTYDTLNSLKNQGKGGFDHAAVHLKSSVLYRAHTSNDSLEVIDCHQDKYLRSIPNLMGVAGVLVSNERDIVFT